VDLPVLAIDLNLGLGVATEAGGEFDQPSLSTKQLEVESGDRSVGNRGESVAQGALDGIGAADEVDLDRLGGGAFEFDDEVWELVVRGA
jgi:hypothetical protein